MPRLAPHLEKPQFCGRLRDELLSATPRNGNKAQSPPTMRQLLKLLTRRAVTSKPYEGTSPEAETSTLAPFPAVLALSLAKTHAPGLRRAPEPEGGSEYMREHAFPPGEVAELKPGKSGHLSLRLKPASYVLYWN